MKFQLILRLYVHMWLDLDVLGTMHVAGVSHDVTAITGELICIEIFLMINDINIAHQAW